MEESKRWPLEEVLLDLNSGIKSCRSKEKKKQFLADDQPQAKNQAFDRFIPRRNMDDDIIRLDFLGEKENFSGNVPNKQIQVHQKQTKGKQRLLRFNGENKAVRREDDYLEDLTLKGLIRINRSAKKAAKQLRKAEKVLDAPGLVNDYYLNLIDWGKNNMLAVCLGDGAFVWNASTQDGHQFFSSDNSLMIPTAIGFSNSQVHIRDFEKDIVVRELDDHWARVSALSWNSQHHSIFSTSSKDCEIINYDLRTNRSISVMRGHTQEVCGLKWSPDGSLLASGGNDNALMIWDLRKPHSALQQFREHKAAVKALAWCPWQKNLIVSGGGSEDKSIKFWRVDEGRMVSSHKASSQVCSLLWNPLEKELLSAHGYSQYQLSLWRYPSMDIIGEYFGHKDRVLHLSLSPDMTTVVSAGADETLRFWKVFETSKDCFSQPNSKSILAPLSIR